LHFNIFILVRTNIFDFYSFILGKGFLIFLLYINMTTCQTIFRASAQFMDINIQKL